MCNRWWPALLSSLFLTALPGCVLSSVARDRLLVWHDWPEAEAVVLTELLSGYAELDRALEIIVEHVPPEDIESRFAEEVDSGFGPDVLIGADAAELTDLVEGGAVRVITPAQAERYGFDRLDARALSSMAIDDMQSGVPLTAFTDVLYVRDGVEPPDSLADIIQLAEDGHAVAIPLDFFDAYWGVDAFGGTVFGEDDGVAPDSGFTQWMSWLVEAREQPNLILDGEYDVLRDLFADGSVDVFVGGSRELGRFRSSLQHNDPDISAAAPDALAADGGDDDTADDDNSDGDDTAIEATTPTLANVGEPAFGVTSLPGGDNDNPGGFLDVEGMVINRHTDSLAGSLALMEYLTNVPSQGRIARAGVGRIPVNPLVTIDSTTSPMEAALVVQQLHAVAMPAPLRGRQVELGTAANEVYLQVTRGLLDPADAGDQLRVAYQDQLESSDE